MGKKFVLSDLDGTLLNEVDALSDPLIAELNELIENGLDFTIATGKDLEKAEESAPRIKSEVSRHFNQWSRYWQFEHHAIFAYYCYSPRSS